MKDFVLLFRQPAFDNSNISPKELESILEKWKNWIGGIAAQGKFTGQNTRLAAEGKVLKSGGVITDGPFVEIREILGGLLVVKAEDMDDATTLAHGCPALDRGGSVEIRPLYEHG
jgi:hypothetical protein